MWLILSITRISDQIHSYILVWQETTHTLSLIWMEDSAYLEAINNWITLRKPILKSVGSCFSFMNEENYKKNPKEMYEEKKWNPLEKLTYLKGWEGCCRNEENLRHVCIDCHLWMCVYIQFVWEKMPFHFSLFSYWFETVHETPVRSIQTPPSCLNFFRSTNL